MTSSRIPRAGPRNRASLGTALKRWRTFNRVKQDHAADLFGVSQSTISRWERGIQAMEEGEKVKVEAVVAANIDAAADRVLARLVFEAGRPMHLVCDRTHRLLACSREREREFGISFSDLSGRSLRRFATAEIAEQDVRLENQGWHEFRVPDPVIFRTGANRSRIVPIRPGYCRWTRLTLSDGGLARLVETLHEDDLSAIQPVRSENFSSCAKR